MSTQRHDNERCETCRFWEAGTTECHRRAPVTLVALPQSASVSRASGSRSVDTHAKGTERTWPRTRFDDWCGEWDSLIPKSPTHNSAMPVGQEIATQTFLGKIAPSLEQQDPATLLEALLNQLPPDIRRVIVRMNGLDGQPLSGLKEVAREFRMSREQVRALVAAGEKRLTEVVSQLTSRRQEKREA
jgi:hypothetical protein